MYEKKQKTDGIYPSKLFLTLFRMLTFFFRWLEPINFPTKYSVSYQLHIRVLFVRHERRYKYEVNSQTKLRKIQALFYI